MHRIKTPVPVESLQAVGLLCDWKVPYHIYDHNYKEKIDWFTIRIMKLRKKIKKFHTSVNSSRDDKRTHEWIYILVHSFNASHHKTRPSKQLLFLRSGRHCFINLHSLSLYVSYLIKLFSNFMTDSFLVKRFYSAQRITRDHRRVT